MDEGATMKDIAAEEFPAFVKFFRGFQKYQAIITPERDFKTRVIVITGDAGTFKSFGLSRMRSRYHVVKPTSSKAGCWYDGYDPVAHACVIFDDFSGNWMPYSNLLEIGDRYACQVQTKGGTVQFTARALGISSNYPCESWYPGMDYSALERRIELHFTHHRCDAPNDAKGLAVNDIVVTVIKGEIECHPLYSILQHIAGKEYKLDTAFQDEIGDMDTVQARRDAWDVLYEAIDYPEPEEEPELSEDVDVYDEVPKPKLPLARKLFADDVMSVSSDDEAYGDSDDEMSGEIE